MSEPVPPKSVAKWSSRLWALLGYLEISFQLLLLGVCVYYFANYWPSSVRFKAALAELDQDHPGWRMEDVEQARDVVPDAENSALRVAEMNSLLPDHWMDDDVGRQIEAVRPETQLPPDQIAHLLQALDQVQPALEKARALADLPKGRYAITYLPDGAHPDLSKVLTPARKAARLLRLDAMAELQAGDWRAAVRSCGAGLNAGRSIGDEPGNLSQLVRIAIVSIACKNVERLLAQAEPDAAELQTLQAALEQEEQHPYWTVVWRGERAMMDLPLEAILRGDLVPLDTEPGQALPSWADKVLGGAYIQDRARLWGPELLAYYSQLETTDQMPSLQRQALLDQMAKDVRKGRNVFLLGFPALAKVSLACSRIKALLRCHATAIAAERYRRQHGDWPQSLEQLTPDLLPAVPTDAFTGDPLLYHRLPEGVVIYSVSADGVDNGGAVDVMNPNDPGADLGVRLWDVSKRRQPPPPPAAPVPPG